MCDYLEWTVPQFEAAIVRKSVNRATKTKTLRAAKSVRKDACTKRSGLSLLRRKIKMGSDFTGFGGALPMWW